MECEPRWADQTWVYTAPAPSGSDGGVGEPERCTFALLFRFMNSQGALYRTVEKPLETVMQGPSPQG